MCLAIPGKVLSIETNNALLMGQVDFSGVIQTVCLAYTPEVVIGDYVIVHVGFSISILQEKKAKETLSLLERGTFE